MESKAARQYFSRVRRRLVCSTASRKQLLSQGQELINRFEQENPYAQYADFADAFGPPEDFAREMLSTVDRKEVDAAQRRQRHAKWTVLVGLLLILIAVPVFGFAHRNVLGRDHVVINSTPHQIAEEALYTQFLDYGDGVYVIRTVTQDIQNSREDMVYGAITDQYYFQATQIGSAALTVSFDISGPSAVARTAALESTGTNGFTVTSGSSQCIGNNAFGVAAFWPGGTKKYLLLSISCNPDGGLY